MTDDNPASEGAHAILLVEDDEDVGDFIKQTLNDELPHSVLYVTDASHALQVVHSIKPVLFILDYQLPGINGLELSGRLHDLDEFQTVPTLLISANLPSRKAIDQSYLSFLAKPFDLAELLQAVKQLLPEQQM